MPGYVNSGSTSYLEPALWHEVVRYEGDVTDGKFHGVGEAVFHAGFTYKGEFEFGTMHGTGVLTWQDGMKYKGTMVDNTMTGQGTFSWADGSNYVGGVLRGLRHGQGVFKAGPSSETVYEGTWVMGKRQGKGSLQYNSRSIYVGDFVNNHRQGSGKMVYESGNTYEGEWFENRRHGQGIMKWVGRGETYSGSWDSGLQNGIGEYTWYLQRFSGSQYPARNRYVGEWLDGKRQGQGTYFYASGAVYEGMWASDLKQGQGRYTFDNGYVYEGPFLADAVAGVVADDAYEQFLFDVEDLVDGGEEDPQKVQFEMERLRHAMLLHISDMLSVYTFYSSLGCDSPDNTYLMTRLQFHRMLKDAGITALGMSLCDVDRVIQVVCDDWSLHSPTDTMLPRQFLTAVVRVAHHLYAGNFPNADNVLATCANDFVAENILRSFNSINRVKGYLFRYPDADNFVDTVLDNLPEFCRLYDTYASDGRGGAGDRTLTSRSMLIMLNELDCYNVNGITAEAPVSVMAEDNAAILLNGVLDMHVELSHLEMIEVIIGCAVYDHVPDELETVVFDVPSIVESSAIDSVAEENADEVAAATAGAEGDESGAAADSATGEGQADIDADSKEAAAGDSSEEAATIGADESDPTAAGDESGDAATAAADASGGAADTAAGDGAAAGSDGGDGGEDGEDGEGADNGEDSGASLAVVRQPSMEVRVSISQQGSFAQAPAKIESSEFIKRTKVFLEKVLLHQ